MYVSKRAVSFILLVVISVSLLSNELIPGLSSYSFNLGVLDCNNLDHLKGCRHEIGHKMDHDLGMPSESYEFGKALQNFMFFELNLKEEPSELGWLLFLYPGVYTHGDGSPPQRELYAAIYAWAEGDYSRIPDVFKPFYSPDPSYLELYDCLADPGINVCGTSISNLKG